MHTRPAAVVLFAALAMASAAAQERFTKQDADRFQAKLGKIVLQANGSALKTAQPRLTPLTDVELNSYLRLNAKDQVPVGLLEPTLHALGDGRVSGSAVVDLDAVRKQKQRSWSE